MPLRPTPPMPKAADVQRRERSWVFAAGQRQFSLTRVEYSATFVAGHRIEAPRARGLRPTAILGTMLATLGGATLLGLAVNASRANAGYRYVVSVPVPPARPAAKRFVAASAHKAAKTAARPVATDRAAPPGAVAARARPAMADVPGYVVGDLDTAEATALATSMTGAVRAAMASGHLQQWSTPDGAERGFVVVGPADAEGKGCRALSILTRRDGENHVESRRECRGGVGSQTG